MRASASDPVIFSLVIQAPEVPTPALKELARRTGASRIAGLPGGGTQAFRLEGAGKWSSTAAFAPRSISDFAFVPAGQRLGTGASGVDGHGLGRSSPSSASTRSLTCRASNRRWPRSPRRRCAARSTSARASCAAWRCLPGSTFPFSSASTANVCTIARGRAHARRLPQGRREDAAGLGRLHLLHRAPERASRPDSP